MDGLVRARPDKMLPWLLSHPNKENTVNSEVQRLRMALWSLTRAVGRDECSDLLLAVIRERKSEHEDESRGMTKCLRNHLSWLMPKMFSWDFRLIVFLILHNAWVG